MAEKNMFNGPAMVIFMISAILAKNSVAFTCGFPVWFQENLFVPSLPPPALSLPLADPCLSPLPLPPAPEPLECSFDVPSCSQATEDSVQQQTSIPSSPTVQVPPLSPLPAIEVKPCCKPAPPQPSVTIPNIILALLPPTAKKSSSTASPSPKPAPATSPSFGFGGTVPSYGCGCCCCQPTPITIPVPQPRPYVILEDTPCSTEIKPQPSVTIPNIIAALLPPSGAPKLGCSTASTQGCA